jgi:hypothetical protein
MNIEIEELSKILLAKGGKESYDLAFTDPDLARILIKKGRFYRGPSRKWFNGLNGCCHQLSVFFERAFPGIFTIFTGTALSGGRWIRHTWLVENVTGDLVETASVRADKYYGVNTIEEGIKLCALPDNVFWTPPVEDGLILGFHRLPLAEAVAELEVMRIQQKRGQHGIKCIQPG